MTNSPLMDVALLRGYAPYTLAGYASFRSVIESDGAVPAKLKALFATVAAVDRRHLTLARQEMERGVALGLTPKDATAGLIVLSSLRGEAAALDFAQIISDSFDNVQAPQPQPLPKAGHGEAEANFRAYWAGAIPAPLGALMRLVPEAADPITSCGGAASTPTHCPPNMASCFCSPFLRPDTVRWRQPMCAARAMRAPATRKLPRRCFVPSHLRELLRGWRWGGCSPRRKRAA